jgi:hypothetical protein
MLLFSKLMNLKPREITQATIVKEKVQYDY